MDRETEPSIANQTVWEAQVGSSYGNGWRQLKKYFLELLLIAIIGIVVSAPVGWFTWAEEGMGDLFPIAALAGIFGFAYTILLLQPIQYGISYAYLRAARGDILEIKDILEVFHNYVNAILANLLTGVIVMIGLFLLIIPGIVFACKLAFVPYLVVDQRMEAIQAVKTSWNMTSGYSWKVFLIGLVAIPLEIAGLICFGVGIIFATMWISLAFASLYHAVSTKRAASSSNAVS